MRICISIISWMPMRKTQHEGRVLNSSANPLPAAFFGAEIPLSEVSPSRGLKSVFPLTAADATVISHRRPRRTGGMAYARAGVCFARNAATRALAEVSAAPVFHSATNSQFGVIFESFSEIG